MSKRVGLMGTAGYRYLAIFLWCFFPLAGLASGWGLLINALAVAFSSKDNPGLFLFFFFLTLAPLAFAISTGLGVWLGLKAWKKGKVGNADQDHLD